MPNQLTLVRNLPHGSPDHMVCTVAVTGNYTVGGDTCDLTPSMILDPKVLGVLGLFAGVPPTPAPDVQVSNSGGYWAAWVNGTNAANGKLQWFTPGGAEVAAGAYPAAVLASKIAIEVPVSF